MAHTYIFVAALVIAGWAAWYFRSRSERKRTCERIRAELRLEFQQQVDSLAARLRTLERTGEIGAAAATANRMPSDDAHAIATAAAAAEEITPEILRTIAATITALLGRKVRIRAVKILETPDSTTNSWAQHGRAVIHASHNLVPRGHEL